jgi:hypothetical protein
MMRALLFLGLTGAVIYGFLVVTHDALSDGNPKIGLAVKTQSHHPADEQLSSWGSYLPSRSQSQTLPSQEGSEPSENPARYRLAPSENRDGYAESDDLKSESSIAAPIPAQVAAESTTEPLTTKPSIRKSSKRSRSAKNGVLVASADPWSGRWSRGVERRRGFGLFIFRPFPNGR